MSNYLDSWLCPRCQWPVGRLVDMTGAYITDNDDLGLMRQYIVYECPYCSCEMINRSQYRIYPPGEMEDLTPVTFPPAAAQRAAGQLEMGL